MQTAQSKRETRAPNMANLVHHPKHPRHSLSKWSFNTVRNSNLHRKSACKTFSPFSQSFEVHLSRRTCRRIHLKYHVRRTVVKTGFFLYERVLVLTILWGRFLELYLMLLRMNTVFTSQCPCRAKSDLAVTFAS